MHIERIKSFTNLADRIAVEDNEAQSTDPTDGEDTTDNASTDDDTPAEQRLKKTSNKKKQTKEKKVRFTTAEEETRTSAETEEITQQAETDQSRRYPLRIRKKRFALASTLLYAMVLAVTTNTQPTEAVAQTTTENPASWWPIMLLLTTMKTLPTDGTLEVKLSSHGVIFQSLGVIVTDISFDQGDKVVNELKLWLTEKTKLPIPDSSNYKDGQILPSVKTTDHTSRIQIQKSRPVGPNNSEKSHQQLTTIVRDRAVYELARLETIERNYRGLKESIKQKRNKRGMIDGGGKILNWLFGVSTTEELDKVNNQVAKLSTETTAMVHALETHTTLINETI